ncbi:Homeodomain-like protein, partial [Syncephalis pseudoplumigaleata]
LPNRTPAECMIRWVAHEHPLINKSEWSVEEDAMLRSIAKKHKERNWDRIALELKTNRTSWQCFKQYRSHLWEEQGRRKWTPEEDAILSQAVAMCGERNWQQGKHMDVATCFEHRTGQQCLHRWTKTLKPGMRKGRWSPEEDEALRSAVALHGASNWVKVAAHVMERSDVQCRERWTNVLDPSIARGQWHADEDARLLELVAKHGAHSWAAVAREMGIQRTDN